MREKARNSQTWRVSRHFVTSTVSAYDIRDGYAYVRIAPPQMREALGIPHTNIGN